MFWKQKTEGASLEVIQFVSKTVWREEVRLGWSGLRQIRLNDGCIIRWWRPLMANHPPSIWNGIQSPKKHNQLCCQPSGNYRPIQMQHIFAFPQKRRWNIGSKKVENLHSFFFLEATRHTLRAPSPLTWRPLMSRFEVFEMNMTVISSGQQARHFSCARKTRYREQG